ncbi:hypothetical protein CDAR_23611 [Caerostris darwini]|uniref:Uncharacterized protein n=1 Tax=Caerostris darwini TaxID=1538125 RepID=A0AAV4RVH3_9ARAC|nr:hypothetical protein CDAR_23611 [Caerostris darwini]
MSDNFSACEMPLERESANSSKDGNPDNSKSTVVRNGDEIETIVASAKEGSDSFEDTFTDIIVTSTTKPTIFNPSSSQSAGEKNEKSFLSKGKVDVSSENTTSSITEERNASPTPKIVNLNANIAKIVNENKKTIASGVKKNDVIFENDVPNATNVIAAAIASEPSKILDRSIEVGFSALSMKNHVDNFDFYSLDDFEMHPVCTYNDEEEAMPDICKELDVDDYCTCYTEELAFAMDVATLIARLNHRSFDSSKYSITGDRPASPCNEIVYKAIEMIWARTKDDVKRLFDKTKEEISIDYPTFRNLLMEIACDIEEKPFCSKRFLSYCVVLCQLSVFAADIGIDDALYCVPIILCHTLFHFAEKKENFTSIIWERLAQTSNKIVQFALEINGLT